MSALQRNLLMLYKEISCLDHWQLVHIVGFEEPNLWQPNLYTLDLHKKV